ncbi:hypothetical protein T439DRAFT_328082 [Meredithblackwellia eburnea MCA 4105]
MAPRRSSSRKAKASPTQSPPPSELLPESQVESEVGIVEREMLAVEPEVHEQGQPEASTSALPAASASSKFTQFRSNLKSHLSGLIVQLAKHRRSTSAALPEDQLIVLVDRLLEEVGVKPPEKDADGKLVEDAWKVDVRRSIMDRTLEELLLQMSLSTPQGEESDYALICDFLDVVLVITEKGLTDESLPLNCISAVLDLQPIEGCHKIFNYIESRVERLTKNMHPQKGKGPVLLRLLNDLLRRLPKSKPDDVIFSGRILMFLSSVFPLGEKSGVNLRGNFNTGKGTVWEEDVADEKAKMEGLENEKMEGVVEEEEEEGESKEAVEEKDDDPAADPSFYNTFWSLQRSFNNPPSLFASPSAPSTPLPSSNATTGSQFPLLKNAIEKTLKVFARQTKMEREVAGSGVKEKQELEMLEMAKEKVMEHYFFPMFLTSKNLLGLELADPAFRRQILVQALVLFQYLLGFTVEEKTKSQKMATNNAALLNHTLSEENAKWIEELREQTLAELKSMEGGEAFTATVVLILQRERNWINWKLRSCQPFSKPALEEPKASTTAKQKLVALTRKQKPWMWKVGNAALSRLWEKDTKTLTDMGDITPEKNFYGLYKEFSIAKKMQEQKKELRRQLETEKTSEAKEKLITVEIEIQNLQVRLDAFHWRALRSAAATNLKDIFKTSATDLDSLYKWIEEEPQREEEKRAKHQGQGQGQGQDTNLTSGEDKLLPEGEEELSLGGEKIEAPADTVAVKAEEDVAEITIVEPVQDEGQEPPPAPAPEPEVEEKVETVEVIEIEDSDVEVIEKPPGTPKRRRVDEDGDDAMMAEGASEAKKAKTEE